MPIEADALERVGIQRIHDSPKVIAAVARDDWHRCGMCGLRLSLEEVSVDILLAVSDKADVLATILLKVDRGPCCSNFTPLLEGKMYHPGPPPKADEDASSRPSVA
jgi:hypothetical protein